MEATPITKSKTFKISLLLLIFLSLGLFLRIYNLASESIWLDEGISIRIASQESLYKIANEKWFDFPLYHFILHYWIGLFGTSEFSVRFPSVIFGLLILFMSYKVGALIFDTEVGILSSFLLAFSTFHIQYSQEARMYSLMGFLTLVSMYYFIKFVKEKSIAVSIKYLIFSLLLIFTHLFSMLIIFSQSFYIFTLFFLSKDISINKLKKWISLQAILFISFVSAVLLVYFLSNNVLTFFIKYLKVWWIPKPSFVSIVVSFLEYSGSLQLMLVFFILALLAIINFQKFGGKIISKSFFESLEKCQLSFNLEGIKSIYLLLNWLFLPIITLSLISIFFFPIYWTRYTIGSSLAFYLLVAKGIKNIRKYYAKLLMIGIIILFSLINVMTYYREINNEDWRALAKYIDKNAQLSDLLIFNPGHALIPFNYYSKRGHLNKRHFLEIYETVDGENIKRLEKIVGGHTRIWIILSHNRDPNGLIKKYFNNSFNLLYSTEYLRSRFVNIKLGKFINKEEVAITLYLFSK
jgi:mannosyltransferase